MMTVIQRNRNMRPAFINPFIPLFPHLIPPAVEIALLGCFVLFPTSTKACILINLGFIHENDRSNYSPLDHVISDILAYPRAGAS